MKKELLETRIKRLEATVQNRVFLKKRSPEELALLREIAVLVVKDIIRNGIKPGDEEGFAALVKEIQANQVNKSEDSVNNGV